MKKLLLILNIILFFTNQNHCHIPQIIPYESEQMERYEDECPTCEQIFQMHNTLSNLNLRRTKLLENLQQWLVKTPLTHQETEQIQRLIDAIKETSNQIVLQLPHNNKIDSLLNTLSTLVHKIDLLLSEDNELEKNDYFEIFQQMRDIYSLLSVMQMPGNYNHWLAKRLKLQ